MAGTLSPLGGAGWQFFTNAGVVLNGGQLFTYAAGSSTLLPTYTDSTLATPNGNPILLNAYGRSNTEIWLQNNVGYKFVLQDANSNTIGTWDNVVGINSVVTTASEWVSNNLVVTYATATTFTVPGNQTSIFTVNRRLQYFLTAGTFYGYVSASTYDGTSTTTVTIVPDSTNLNATLSAVNYGILNPTNPSVPQNYLNTLQPVNSSLSGSTPLNFSATNGSAGVFAAGAWGVTSSGGAVQLRMTAQYATQAAAYAAAAGGTYATQIPMSVNTSTGALTFDSAGVGTTFGGSVTTTNHIGPGSGLTGYAAGLSIGGNAATATNGLTTGNYNAYAPTLTGTGATGTWNINVTGTAATATTALAVTGVTDGSNAAAGKVGEVITNSGTVSPAASTSINVTSVTLTAGDWDVEGSVWLNNGVAAFTQTSSLSTSSAANAAVPYISFGYTPATAPTIAGPVPMQRLSITGSTPVYLVTNMSVAGTATGVIIARRRR